MGASRLQPSPHACDPGHDRHPAVFPCSPLLLRAKPSKGGDAEPRGYGGSNRLARRAASASPRRRPFLVGGGQTMNFRFKLSRRLARTKVGVAAGMLVLGCKIPSSPIVVRVDAIQVAPARLSLVPF